MTPDWAAQPTAVPYASFSEPQSLNLYGYVRNNPLAKANGDGYCPPSSPNCKTLSPNPFTSLRH